jgi:predicted acyl esterase
MDPDSNIPLFPTIVLAFASLAFGCKESTGARPGDAGTHGGGPVCSAPIFEDVAVPLSDGKHLAGFVRRPPEDDCRLPAILVQTPYNKENVRALWFSGEESNPLFESQDYAFVVVDWRGFHGSAAAAVPFPDHGADGHDVVEWIAAQPWSNGKVGTWGVSALGRVQYWTAVHQPPHLVTAVPIFCTMNQTYLEYYPGGVLRRELVDTLEVLFGHSLIEAHPREDLVWSWLANQYDPADVKIPLLLVAGWYDLDNARSFRDWEAFLGQPGTGVGEAHRLLVGPWHHFAAGGESAGAGRPLTAEELRYHDRERRIQKESLAWFDYWMRGIDRGVSGWARVRYLAGGEATWSAAPRWPLPSGETRAFYLRREGLLAESPGPSEALSFRFDPRDPSPTCGGQTLRPDLLHGPQDQAEVLARDDRLVFTTAPLPAGLRLRGPLELRLAVTTTGADTDFVVRVTDVDPQGRHLLLADGVRRLSLRDTYAAKSPVAPGTRYEIEVPVINQLAYNLGAGHRLGIILTSSSWPRFERNPGTGDDFYAAASNPQAVTNTIFCDSASRLLVTVDP